MTSLLVAEGDYDLLLSNLPSLVWFTRTLLGGWFSDMVINVHDSIQVGDDRMSKLKSLWYTNCGM